MGPGGPARLLVAELRLALFQEGGHAFFLVLGGEHRMEHPPFEQDTFGQRGLV